jgi:hypothetical protein
MTAPKKPPMADARRPATAPEPQPSKIPNRWVCENIHAFSNILSNNPLGSQLQNISYPPHQFWSIHEQDFADLCKHKCLNPSRGIGAVASIVLDGLRALECP